MTIHDPKAPRQVYPEQPYQQQVPQVLPQQMVVHPQQFQQPIVQYVPQPKNSNVWWIIASVAVVVVLVALMTGFVSISNDEAPALVADQPAAQPTLKPNVPARKPAPAPRTTTENSAAPVVSATSVPEPTPDVNLKLNPNLEAQKTDIHPDGSYTINGGQVRYYVDTENNIAEVRLPGVEGADYVPDNAGAPPEQKIFLQPTSAADIAYLNAIPTAVPYTGNTACASRHGCPKP